ncbi:hypothetical protein AAC387_Pa06g0150 [Persea americana]
MFGGGHSVMIISNGPDLIKLIQSKGHLESGRRWTQTTSCRVCHRGSPVAGTMIISIHSQSNKSQLISILRIETLKPSHGNNRVLSRLNKFKCSLGSYSYI